MHDHQIMEGFTRLAQLHYDEAPVIIIYLATRHSSWIDNTLIGEKQT